MNISSGKVSSSGAQVIRIFRLTNEPGRLGLSCTSTGVALAGVPLLQKTEAGFVSRPLPEIATLIQAAYGADPTRLQSSLDGIAQALNRGDLARATIMAVLTRTPQLNREAAARLADSKRSPGTILAARCAEVVAVGHG